MHVPILLMHVPILLYACIIHVATRISDYISTLYTYGHLGGSIGMNPDQGNERGISLLATG